FLVAAFEISVRGRRYPSLGWNVVEYLALFLIVMLHEFGHALACRQVGGTANKIMLWPLGGVAYVDPPPRPGATLWSIAAGPLVNVLLLLVLSVAGVLGRSFGWASVAPHAYVLLWAVWFMNLGLLIFNMLPIYPLDGGQILQSLLWFVLGRARSLKVVTIIGLFGAAGLIVLALWLHSVWIGILSLFIVMNCWAGLQHAQVLSRSGDLQPRSGVAIRAEYTEITDPKLQARVRARYEREIASLQSFGFRHLAYCLEVLPPYSAILRFPLVLAMFNKEIVVFPRPARLAVATVLFVHSDPASIADCMGMGVKFHTGFSDGALLISSSYRSPLVPAPNSRIIKNARCQSAEEAWLAHKKRAAELEAEGIAIHSSCSFGDYVEISKRKEDGMLPEV
ncbi:MAG: M50 family metallopeptidase, partial [Acidobacteriia bacterium]|nr:M50 family metallopeptidase [Terriglobia bacterium]